MISIKYVTGDGVCVVYEVICGQYYRTDMPRRSVIVNRKCPRSRRNEEARIAN